MTPTDVKSALTALPALAGTLERILTGAATLTDAETIGEDILMAAGVVDPEILPAVTIAEWLLPIVVSGFMSGQIRPDPLPMTDAQTTLTHHEGRGNG